MFDHLSQNCDVMYIRSLLITYSGNAAVCMSAAMPHVRMHAGGNAAVRMHAGGNAAVSECMLAAMPR